MYKHVLKYFLNDLAEVTVMDNNLRGSLFYITRLMF